MVYLILAATKPCGVNHVRERQLSLFSPHCNVQPTSESEGHTRSSLAGGGGTYNSVFPSGAIVYYTLFIVPFETNDNSLQ